MTLDRVTIDGSGGYLGVAGDAEVEARDSTFTCDVQVSGRGTASLWTLVRDGIDGERNRWNFWDSASMGLGAILIGLSYLIDTPAGTP